MHVVCVSYFYDRSLTAPADLLARYVTLTGWAEGTAQAGADVTVVQRFGMDAEVYRNGVRYRFVCDPAWRFGSLFDPARRTNRLIAQLRPDVVHVNGLSFARQAYWLKRRLPRVPILLQDHANHPPRGISSMTLRLALRRLDAVSFAARELACPWMEAGLLRADMPVFELMEGSSRFRLQSRAEARAATGLTGDPLSLWVGRLNANKDPLTVLHGLALVLCRLPHAHLVMVYDEEALLPEIRAWLTAHPSVASCVTLIGRLPHEALEAVYNSADFFLLGSRQEGSGYAVLEALSCGVAPIVTDIPSFRRLTANGECGGLWPVGDVEALACALLDAQGRRQEQTPERIRAFFEANWSFAAIGRQAAAAYAQLVQKAGK